MMAPAPQRHTVGTRLISYIHWAVSPWPLLCLPVNISTSSSSIRLRASDQKENAPTEWMGGYSYIFFLFCLVSYSFLLLYFPTRLKERGENIYILDTFILFLLRYLWRFKVDTFYGTSQVPKSITQNISIRRDWKRPQISRHEQNCCKRRWEQKKTKQ